MPKYSTLFRVGALACLLPLWAARAELAAQTAIENQPATAATPDEFSQAELLKSYLRVREQLHAAELAIVNNRIEAEASARAQAAAITEKLDAIRASMAAERERQQTEAMRAATEHEREQAEAQRSNRTILWVGAAFGGTGLLAIVVASIFQWRAMKRMSAVISARPALPGAVQSGQLTLDAPAGQSVGLSSQRLMSVIDRMERRIFELEHTAHPPPVEPAAPAGSATPDDATARIGALLLKGRALLNTNQAQEAVACYDEILGLEANHPEALLKKGVAMERLKQDHEAIRYYDRAIEVDRKMTLAYLYKGGVCNRQQRYDEALACYEQALQVEEAVK